MRVFISHAFEDSEVVRILAEELSRAQIDVWNPYQDLNPGDNVAMKVGEALERSDVMVIVWSANARVSKSLQNEIDYALSSKKYQGRLFTVVLGDKSTLPWVLAKASRMTQCSQDPTEIEGGEFHGLVKQITGLPQMESNAT